jgi:hypothetical protein
MAGSGELRFFLDAEERRLVADVFAFVRPANASHAERLDGHLERLAQAANVIRTSPSISQSLEGRPRTAFSGEPLIDVLCRVPDWDLDLHIPTKAVFGQAYLVAKINFFKSLGYTVDTLGAPPELHERIQVELGQSIYSKLAEELFISIVTDPTGEREVKLRAAKALFQIWEDRLSVEIDDFAPVLESIWDARDKVRPVLGTMRGTQEFFQLLQTSRDTRFLDYFGEGNVPEEQVQAFDEFLFGISHEEITKLREHLQTKSASVVSTDEARGLLGRTRESWAPGTGPQALYTSYKRRRVKAHYRELTGVPGPKRTAEEYVMIAFLASGHDPTSR